MHLEEAGVLWTTPNICSPLDDLQLLFRFTGLCGQPVTFEVQDGDHQVYLTTTVTSEKGQATVRVRPGGQLGVHNDGLE